MPSAASSSNRDRRIEHAFGQVLRDLRLARGLSQEQLGYASDTGRTFISELERGTKGITLRTLFRIADALNQAPSGVIALVEEILAGD
jgi:transcriptional regulator with XRE-family HTH domain